MILPKSQLVRHFRQHPLDVNRPKRINEFLLQDKIWVNAQLDSVRIKDMDSDYIMSTMIHLLNRAPAVMLAIHIEMGIVPNQAAEVLMQATPLFMKLRERYEKLINAGS